MDSNVKVIDGGFSTQLKNYVGEEIDGDPLWSARFLLKNPQAVYQTHLDFLNAGADIIITDSYQASVPGFMKYLNFNEESSYDLIKEAVRIAKQAVDSYSKKNPKAEKPLIAGSVGPYGAFLHDGSEYTGSYIENTKIETIIDFHRVRIKALTEEKVDFLAIETIPAQAEAESLIKFLKKEYPNQKAWLSFQCKDAEHTAHGENFTEAVRKCWELANGQLIAVGSNCVNPTYVNKLIKNVNVGIKEKIPLIIYPNSGEEYSEAEWTGKEKCVNLGDFVHDWLNLGVKYVGGCCRTDARDVRSIREAVEKWLLEKKAAL